MQIHEINLYDLKNVSSLSPFVCTNFSEAAAVCLGHHNHPEPVNVQVIGDLEQLLAVSFGEVSEQLLKSHKDKEYAVEDGAYCLAMLIIEYFTDFTIAEQATKRIGVDYFLNKKGDASPTPSGKLEVSGILKGTKQQINQRIRQKVKQVQKGGFPELTAFIIVVEFSTPLIKVKKL